VAAVTNGRSLTTPRLIIKNTSCINEEIQIKHKGKLNKNEKESTENG
jgi:hypothetical protein